MPSNVEAVCFLDFQRDCPNDCPIFSRGKELLDGVAQGLRLPTNRALTKIRSLPQDMRMQYIEENVGVLRRNGSLGKCVYYDEILFSKR